MKTNNPNLNRSEMCERPVRVGGEAGGSFSSALVPIEVDIVGCASCVSNFGAIVRELALALIGQVGPSFTP